MRIENSTSENSLGTKRYHKMGPFDGLIKMFENDATTLVCIEPEVLKCFQGYTKSRVFPKTLCGHGLKKILLQRLKKHQHLERLFIYLVDVVFPQISKKQNKLRSMRMEYFPIFAYYHLVVTCWQ